MDDNYTVLDEFTLPYSSIHAVATPLCNTQYRLSIVLQQSPSNDRFIEFPSWTMENLHRQDG